MVIATLICAYVILGLASFVLVMAHSGRGTGLSVGMRQSLSDSASVFAERNVNRMTAVTFALFVICTLVLARLLH